MTCLKARNLKKELKEDLQDKTLAHKLYGMRCAAGITQTEMAKLMGCKQGRISKLENAGLNSIKVGDLLAYTKALGLNLLIGFRKGDTSKERIKYDILGINKQIDQLYLDKTIPNLLNIVMQCIEGLPDEEDKDSSSLEIQTPIVEKKNVSPKIITNIIGKSFVINEKTKPYSWGCDKSTPNSILLHAHQRSADDYKYNN